MLSLDGRLGCDLAAAIHRLDAVASSRIGEWMFSDAEDLVNKIIDEDPETEEEIREIIEDFFKGSGLTNTQKGAVVLSIQIVHPEAYRIMKEVLRGECYGWL